MSISVRQLHPVFVGEVSGVDLAEPLSPDTVEALQQAIDRYAVLVFHDQKLDDDRLMQVGRAFGNIEPPRNHRVVRRLKHAELADISNLDANNQLRARDDHRRLDSLANQLWHSDASFKPVPAFLSIMCAYETPAEGGTTMFVSLRAAYDRLPPERKAELDPVNAIHDYV